MSDTHTDKLSEIMNVKEPITYDEQVKRIVACIADNKRTLVVKHHNQKYGGKFPLWVLIEFFSMGTLSYLYADLLTPDKKQIASASFNTSADCLQSWLRCLTDLRNRCAHYSRLYYWIFSAVPKTPQNAPWRFFLSIGNTYCFNLTITSPGRLCKDICANFQKLNRKAQKGPLHIPACSSPFII